MRKQVTSHLATNVGKLNVEELEDHTCYVSPRKSCPDAYLKDVLHRHGSACGCACRCLLGLSQLGWRALGREGAEKGAGCSA